MSTQKKNVRPSFFIRYKATLIAAIASGLYPVLFYYTNNFSLINSWKHLGFFICFFLLAPIVTFIGADMLFKRPSLQKWNKHIVPFLNVFAFLLFIQLCIYAKLQVWFTLGIILISLLFARFLYRLLSKLVVIQFLLAIISLFWLFPIVKNQLMYSSTWMQQPDNIEAVVFKKRPNIYYIQPDGYVNFSEIDKGYYRLDDDDFKNYLLESKFTLYPGVRSNYTSTLVSNSATFAMKHHYYNNGFNFSEIANAREVIVSDNPVLRIFNNNNYKTHFLAEWGYILTNFPKMGYDVCNFDYKEMSFISEGFETEQDVMAPLETYIQEDPDRQKFFFIEIFKPGHVESKKHKTTGIVAEKELYISNLKMAHEKLKNVINLIQEKDPDALIMIMADHGGYVGFEYMLEIRKNTTDRDKLYSAFSTNLAIKWPEGMPLEFDPNFQTGVNVFRTLFSYLSEDTSYLEHLQDDGSYTIINEGAPKGIYKVIDSNGNITFKKQ